MRDFKVVSDISFSSKYRAKSVRQGRKAVKLLPN